jgi:hypothetical protein
VKKFDEIIQNRPMVEKERQKQHMLVASDRKKSNKG